MEDDPDEARASMLMIAFAAALLIIVPTAVNATVDCSKLPPETACLPGSQEMVPSSTTPALTLTPVTTSIAGANVVTPTHPKLHTKKAKYAQNRAKLKRKVGSDRDRKMIMLNQQLNKKEQKVEQLQNIIKKGHDTRKSTINNIK